MTHKLPATMLTSVLALLLLPACSGKSAPQDATPAAGALGSTLPKTQTTVKPVAIDSTLVKPAIVDHKADLTAIDDHKAELTASPTTLQKIEPVEQPAAVPPSEALGGVRFGARHRPARRVVRLS